MNTKHLKAKILDLAIRGKLVPQDSSEGNAAELLQKIREEKKAVVEALETTKQKKIKEDKNTSFIIKAEDGRHYEQFVDGSLKDIEEEIPFEIPENWCWCKVSEIANKITDGEHNTPKRINFFQGFYLLSARNIQNGHLSLNDVDYVDEKEFNRIFARCNPQKNDVLISCSGSVGRCTRIEDDNKYVMVRSAAMISAPSIDTKYLMYTIQSPELQNQIQYASKQTAQANLFQGAISNLIIPLPPLSEQKRIVSAIEKAFEQIDIIEKHKLNIKTYIKQTKSKVLDLAIHGKLVEQNPQEGNAFELLEKIRNDRTVAGACGSTELVKQKKLKEDKKASFIIKAEDGKHYEQFVDGSLKDVEEEIPFEIPENWCWCRLDSIATIERGGSPRPISHFLTKNKDGVNWIKIGDTKKGDKYIENVKEKIIPEGIRHSRLVHAGDFLLTNSMSFGRPYILKVDGCIHDGWLVFGDIYPCITSDFLFQLLSSPFIYESFTLTAAGSTVKNLNIDRVKQVMFPLPPLSEQKRIVAKIEQVFEQLDVLEKSMGE